jgi:hypothetical protein
MNSQEEFEKKLAFGQSGEKEIKEFLQKKFNAFLIPFYQFADSKTAPKGYHNISNRYDKSIILPDLFAVIPNKANKLVSCFIECKLKMQWVEFGNNGRETGIDRRVYEHYLNIQKVTNIPVRIFFLHKNKEPIGLYSISIDIKPNRNGDNAKIKNNSDWVYMTFWREEQLTKIQGFEIIDS